MTIITGSKGYIGSYLKKFLEFQRIEVIGIDRPKNDLTKPLKNIHTNPPHIFHFAAIADVTTSMSDIKYHYENDVTATLNLLEYARKSDAERVMFASSSTVYGQAKQMPTPETAPTNPISNYALFKLMGEQMVKYYAENYGIRSTSMRFSNVVGRKHRHGALNNFIADYKKGKPITIWGSGSQRRNYIYIDDLIRGIMAIYKKQKRTYEAYNIGGDGTSSVTEIIQIFENIVGKKLRKRHIPMKEGELKTTYTDSTKLMRLGWMPKYKSHYAIQKAIKDNLV